MKFGALKAGDYFTKDGDLYRKIYNGMSSKKAEHVATKSTVEIPLMLQVSPAGPPLKKFRQSRRKSETTDIDTNQTTDEVPSDADEQDKN